MKKNKFLKIFIILLIILSIGISSFAYDEDPDEWNYIWLDEAIEESKNNNEPNILARYAVVYDRASRYSNMGKR